MKRILFLILIVGLCSVSTSLATTIPTAPEQLTPLKPYLTATDPVALDTLLQQAPLAPKEATAVLYVFATLLNRPDMMNVLLSHGADPNGQFVTGDTQIPLLAKVILFSEDPDASRILINAGADVNATVEAKGSLPVSLFFFAAKFAKNEETIHLLLDKGAIPTGELLGLNALDMIQSNKYLKKTSAEERLKQILLPK